LHNAIQDALNQLEADGSYGKILAQWGQTDLSIQR
jgi:polar amino acid transport system substrate-binding protein